MSTGAWPVQIQGYRRVFAHTAAVFFQRGIARPETGEISSLSCEPSVGREIVVSVFEVPFTPSAVQASSTQQHVIYPSIYALIQQSKQSCGVLHLSHVQPYDMDLHMIWEAAMTQAVPFISAPQQHVCFRPSPSAAPSSSLWVLVRVALRIA